LQQPVARFVAQGVIDVLEIVEIEEQNGHRIGTPLRQRQRMLHAITEQASVRQQRQRIMKRQLPQFLLERLALADVPKIECESVHRRVVRQIAADDFQDEARGAVFYAQLDRADGPVRRRGHFGEECPQQLNVRPGP
jgi:hypothetical protein